MIRTTTPELSGIPTVATWPEPTPLLRRAGMPVAIVMGTLFATASLPAAAQTRRLSEERLSRTSAISVKHEDLAALVFPLRQKRPEQPTPIQTQQQLTAQRAVAAVERLATRLGITEEAVADLSGFTRRSTSNWRTGQGVYPKTVRNLFEIDGLVQALASSLGGDAFRLWSTELTAEGQPRLNLFGTAEGRAALLAEVRSLIFTRPAVDPNIDSSDLDASARPVSRPDLFREPRTPRRRV